MSAIAGIYHFNKGETVPRENSQSILKSLEVYPANDVQFWHKENVFLGCHAQWITPESIGEQLPYYDNERQLAITSDAIIDNREELFERLQVNKSLRNKMTDSQLILLAYVKWGKESPKYLIGDYAFLIWDERMKIFFGARDFSGARTLYYHQNSQKIAFCTTIQPLFTLPYIKKELNEQWLAEFLAIPAMFDTVDPSTTVYSNIKQIPPSHSLSVIDGKVSISKYCTITPGEKLILKSNEEYEEAFRDVFKTAVSSRLRTYKKVGANLSGGLDSGSVVSFASRELSQQNKQLHTFSYIPESNFKDWTPKHKIADEREFIKSTVSYVGNIDDEYLDFKGKSPYSEINDWLDIQESPYKFIENSFWLKGIYENAQQKGIGVLLNGARGNWSISWGPALDFQAMLLRKFKLFRFCNEVNLYSKNLGVNKSRVLAVVYKKAFPNLYELIRSKEQYELPQLINQEFAKKTAIFEKLKELDFAFSGITDAYEARKRHFEQESIWNINGASGTKLSLRHSLWGRDPSNDLRVIRFALSIPESQCVQNGVDRALIRRVTKTYLPDKVRLNQKIRGIQGADGVHRMSKDWSTFINEVKSLLLDPVITQMINPEVLKNAISRAEGEIPKGFVYDNDFKILMRSIVVSRFIKSIL